MIPRGKKKKWFNFSVTGSKTGEGSNLQNLKTRKFMVEGKSVSSVDYTIYPNRKMAYLDSIKTDVSVRGKGIARNNVSKSLEDMKAKGVETVILKIKPLDSKTSKKELENFYSNIGFKKISGDQWVIENLQRLKISNFVKPKKPDLK